LQSNWQAKHLPVPFMLKVVGDLRHETGRWALLREVEERVHAEWPDCPEKVILAKLRSLERQNLITGCTCGCYGGFDVVVE
jgi:hypothetical protein